MHTVSRRNLLYSGLTFAAASIVNRSAWAHAAFRGVSTGSHSSVPAGYKLVWSDEFNGTTLDRTKWFYRTDTKLLSTQLPENISVSNGNLVIALKHANPGGSVNYNGGGVISKTEFGYGYYECKMRILAGRGWHSSFWMMKYDGSGGTSPAAADLELDVVENDSSNLLSYGVTTHKWKNGHESYGHKLITTPSLSEYRVYGCEYTPTNLSYFFEGEMVEVVDIASLPQGKLNIWLTSIASGHDTDSVDDSRLPGRVDIDYVRFYQRL